MFNFHYIAAIIQGRKKGNMLSSRTARKSKENDFVSDFLETNNLFKNEELNYCILKETITESGVVDIIVVSWEKNKNPNINNFRKDLNKEDFKILHYISTKKSKGITRKTIEKKLGFSERQTKKTINKLVDADLVIRSGSKLSIKDIERNFFLKEIITIEAKLKNWKKVIEQATLNTIFSSNSYILIPEKKAQKTNYFNNLENTGLITFDGKFAKIKKKAKTNRLPASYHSWLINEHIANKMTHGRI